MNHTYGRGGAPAYLAAYDVHAAQVSGRCEPTTGIDPFMNLVTQVMSHEPYASAKRVFWVVDNGSSHRGKKAADRLSAAFPNAILAQVGDRPGAFEDRYNATAQPFQWRFTTPTWTIY